MPQVALRVGDHRVTVVGLDAFRTRDCRQDSFRATAEAGEEMGLDEAGQDADVGFQVKAVDSRAGSDGDEVGVVVGVVLPATIAADDVVAQHLAQLGIGLGAMGAEGVEQGDVFPHDTGGFEFRQKDR
jgi:hypothetical protein